jgi:hypothetical protein
LRPFSPGPRSSVKLLRRRCLASLTHQLPLAFSQHAWSTNDLEYYSPAAVTTVQDPDDETNGFCRFTLKNITTHDLYFEGGEISTWNKFCFTGGRLEAAVRLPGRPDVCASELPPCLALVDTIPLTMRASCRRTLARRLDDGQPRPRRLRWYA